MRASQIQHPCRAANAKPLITENAKRQKRWCDDHKTWTSDDMKYAIWSDKLSFTMFSISGWVHIWRMPKKAYNPAFLVPTVKYGDGSVTIWAAISWYSAGPITTLNGRITTSDYMDILGNPVHSIIQMFLCNNDAIFQEENLLTHTATSVQSWSQEHEYAFQQLTWPAQSPDLNIIKPMKSVLNRWVRSRVPPLSYLKQLNVLHKE